MNVKNNLDNWIAQKKSFSFFLPDGPYGRPFDNQYFIQDIKQVNGELVISLSEGISFHFIGEIDIKEEGCNLIIYGFKRLDFEINGQGQKSYEGGEFCLSGF